ncbi:MAG TPA: cupin domain-containing protein, partial [Gemmatirosa sp.]
MLTKPDALTLLAPMLRVRPELQDYCRLGAGWRSPHAAEATGWAAFHIVVRGACEVERPGQPPVRLDAGDVLLLPHGDAHVVYGGRGRHAPRPISVTDRDYIRVKETHGAAVETELLCGRLHLDLTTEHLLLAALPHVIVLHLTSAPTLGCCGGLVGAIRDELEGDRAGAAAICRDLASAFFVIVLRQYLDDDPPVRGLLALLGQRNTALAAAA